MLNKRGAVCEKHGEYFNVDGEILDLEQHQRPISIRLETLSKTKHEVVVAGGTEKIKALQAVMRVRFIRSLITDEITGRTLLFIVRIKLGGPRSRILGLDTTRCNSLFIYLLGSSFIHIV